SFATHDAVLNDELVQDFVLATLSHGPGAAIQMVPVRERTSILTALGELAELVGVAIDTDRPAYGTGAVARLTVHLRLGESAPRDPAMIAMTVILPEGTTKRVPLTPDPGATDPSIPLEQSFTGEVALGTEAGQLRVTVALEASGPSPRTVARVVPVVSP